MSKKSHREQGKTYTNTIEQDVLKFLASTANDLIVRPFTEIDDAVTQALTRFSQLVDADRSAILQLDEESMTLQMTYEWCKEGINPHLQACRHMSISSTPVMSSMLHQGSSLMTANVASMPDTPMKQLFIDQGIEHLIMISLHSHKQPIGMVFFELMHEYGGISELTKQMLPVFGQMVANAISRKIANEHTHKLTRRLDVVLSRSGIGTWELNLQTGRFSWDDMMCRLYGMEPGSFSGNYNDWVNYLHPDDRPWAEDALGYGRSDLEQESLVFRIVLPSQEIRYIKASSTIIYDDNSTPLRMLGTNIDVTAEKKADLKVREAYKENTLLRERMELALDAAHIGIWEYNIERNSLEWDQWMYALYGITENQFSGAYQAWEKGLHPADKASAIHALEEAIAGRKPFTPTFRVIHPSGAVRYLKASAT